MAYIATAYTVIDLHRDMHACMHACMHTYISDKGKKADGGGTPGSHAITTHCSNCGEAQAQHQWVMVAVSD